MVAKPDEIMGDTRRYWSLMSFYERFEHAVALVLTADCGHHLDCFVAADELTLVFVCHSIP
ncbi:hypothetical protein Nwat_1566 [Nitrosococcus watsonii C-113]|uniref:Uncharacterized protein n=2 Tax=Nitrosococcus TaxID=1227 RepID=D8K6D4_NITWC|nr:hypothetical protein Nwat_1566 [Nitrosococcus watsonii C-113]